MYVVYPAIVVYIREAYTTISYTVSHVEYAINSECHTPYSAAYVLTHTHSTSLTKPRCQTTVKCLREL